MDNLGDTNSKSPRNEKGQFIKTTGSTRYKAVQYNGKRMGEHQKIWIQNFGDIPQGHIIHHKNKNKLDNRIENLECMTYKKHNNIHPHSVWNKGISTHHGNNSFGHKVSKKQVAKQKTSWFNKYLDSNIEIWCLKDKGLTPTKISNELNLTVHQVNHRWKGFNKMIDTNSGRLI